MKLGKYGNGNTKFNKLAVNKLPIHWFNIENHSNIGCGSTTLALLTGINPLYIKPRNSKNSKDDHHYSDRFMISFLRKHNISVYEINKANLSNNKDWKYTLDDRHVILTSNLVKKDEATWGIYWNNTYIHNFEVIKLKPTNFLSFPTVSSYVLYNENWK